MRGDDLPGPVVGTDLLVAVPEDSLSLTEELQPVCRVAVASPQPEVIDLQAGHLCDSSVAGGTRWACYRVCQVLTVGGHPLRPVHVLAL